MQARFFSSLFSVLLLLVYLSVNAQDNPVTDTISLTEPVFEAPRQGPAGQQAQEETIAPAESDHSQGGAAVEIPKIQEPPASTENNMLPIEVMDRMVAELARTNLVILEAVPEPWAQPVEGWPVYDQEILADRLSRIPSVIPLQFNSKVNSYIKVYTVKKREVSQRTLGLKQLYFPMFEEALDRRGMPLELKYLAVVESALNPHAVSRFGATGLWQIMYRTGLSLDLQIDSYIDERRDPERSTEAALDYLQQLYGIFGDWLLAIAAYNCGPGNVNKAIRRSGGKRGIWEIWPNLPRETRGYVPAFIAVAYMMNYPEEHGLQAWKPVFEYELIDTVQFTENASLATIASKIGMTEEELYYYNPSLKRKYVWGRNGAYPLKLPFTKTGAFISSESELYAIAASEQVTAPVVTVASRDERSKGTKYFADPDMTKIVYTVKSGDNLGFIAEWYDCRVQDIRDWNNIYGSRIRAGQKLAIYKKKNIADRFSSINSMSFAQKQGTIGKAVSKPPQKEALASIGGDYFTYTIKSGDNLWDISRKYPGNSIEKILELNDMSRNTKLQPGMKLKLVK